MAHEKNHDYHILDPSIWPFLGALGGFILLFGSVLFLHDKGPAIMIIGYYTRWSINRLLNILSNGYIAGIFGAALSHVFADIIASFLDPHIRKMLFGIVLGGIIPLFFIPFFIFSSKYTMINIKINV